MVKHTQTIHLQQPTNCFSVFDHFVELELKELTGSQLSFCNGMREPQLETHQ